MSCGEPGKVADESAGGDWNPQRQPGRIADHLEDHERVAEIEDNFLQLRAVSLGDGEDDELFVGAVEFNFHIV